MKRRGRQSAKRQPPRRAPESVSPASIRTATWLENGIAHHNAGRLSEAEAVYRQILEGYPHQPGALHLLGLIAFQQGHPEDALDLIRQAIVASPLESVFHCNLGLILRRTDRLDEALASVEKAATLDPQDLKPLLERGQVLFALGRPVEAMAAFESVLRHDGENALAHLGIAFAALALGDFERGWTEFEYRWRHAEYATQTRSFTQPLWDGRPLAGSTILLHAEQGLGDTLQFVRFAPQVKALVGRVQLECQPELKSLLEGAPGVDEVFARGDPAPDFDVHAPLMSLPWLLGTSLQSIPDVVPYLPEAARRVQPGGGRPLTNDGQLKVGLVWAGSAVNQNDHQRSTTLQTFAPLGGVADVAFFGLQKGPAGGQAALPPAGLAFTDLGPDLSDFADTAAAIMQLDLVITVDTAIAHLAGALARPVWVVLPFAPDFRWLLDRDDSPWYPTARLFRQQRRTDWASVMQEVRAALMVLAAAHRPSTATHASTSLSTRTASGVVAALPVNGNIGWAVCGRHIVSELSRLTPVRLVSDPFDAASVGDESTFRVLAGLGASDQDGGEMQRTPQPLLQAITSSTDFAAFRPNLQSSSLTVGYTFFEENILTPDAVQHARRTYDQIVTGSTWCEEVLRGYGLKDISTIVQGIDPLVFHPSPPATRQFGERFVVFSGGKLEFRKGQDLVIRAFKVLQDRHRDVILVNAWFNPWPSSLDTMAASPYIEFKRTGAGHMDFVGQLLVANGIDLEGVVTLPAQPNARMANMYWDTDVGLFPNRCEGGTNLVLMEYMAAGKPAIASYSSGHRDIVTDQNALLIKQMAPLLMNDDDRPIATWDDPSLDETIERLEWAYQHRADLESIAERAGRDLAALTWARTAAAFHDLLEPHMAADTQLQKSTEMRLQAGDVLKLEGFLNRISRDVYPELLSEPHQSITTSMVERLLTNYPQTAEARILDVGCGQGLALREFTARGLRPIGVTLGREDVAACQVAGFDVQEMDQSFLQFADAEFDLVWCRHCLEHSIYPYFTLSEFQRVLKPGGLLYVEVPAPDTSCAHQSNPNHYSVLGKSMWLQLMARSGFTLVDQIDLNFTVPAGPDTYWAFFLRKSA